MANFTLKNVSTGIGATDANLVGLSDDGQTVAFVYGTGGFSITGTLRVEDLGSGASKDVATTPIIDSQFVVGNFFDGTSLSGNGQVVGYSIDSGGAGVGAGHAFATNAVTGDSVLLGTPVPNALVTIEVGGAVLSGDGQLAAYDIEQTAFQNGDPGYQAIEIRDFLNNTVTQEVIETRFDFKASLHVLDLSANGRYLVYTETDQNPVDISSRNLYVKDTQTDTVTQLNTHGFQPYANGAAAVSANGHFVAYLDRSNSFGLPNNEVYVRDLQTGAVQLVSAAPNGDLGNGTSSSVAISADGRVVAFVSDATNLVANDPDGAAPDVFVKNLDTGTVTLVAPAVSGTQLSLSQDGSSVAFATNANFALKGDTDGRPDVYVATFLPPSLAIDPISSDNRINAVEATTPVTVSGTSSAVGQLITITDDFGGIGGPHTRLAAVQPNGTWTTTFSVSGLPDGSHTFSASVIDDTGLVQDASRHVLIDRIPPSLTIGTIAGDDVINSAEAATAPVGGTSDAFGRTVALTIDGTVVGIAFVQGDGTWSTSINATGIADGTHSVVAQVSDLAGNPASASRTISIDETPLTLSITSVSGDNVIDKADVLSAVPVVGTSDALGQNIQLSIDGTPAGTALVQGDGTWHQSLDFSGISGDIHVVRATISDAAGNVTLDNEIVLYDFPYKRESSTASGAQGSGDTDNLGYQVPTISGDGRYIAFEASRAGLVPNETTDFFQQIFLKDALTGAIKMISATPGGVPGDLSSGLPSISADGNYVVFSSQATNLVAGDTDTVDDVYRYNQATGALELVDVAADGTKSDANGQSAVNSVPAISADGRYVAFSVFADNLVPGGAPYSQNLFLKDMQTGAVTLIAANADQPSMSPDARYVTYVSDELVNPQVFVWDRATGTTSLVSADVHGLSANAFSSGGTVSPDGSLVAFYSSATNLTGGPAPPTGAYIKNLATGEVTLLAQIAHFVTDTANAFINGPLGSFSSDNRYFAFTSISSPVPGDPNNAFGTYVVDLVTGAFRLIANEGFQPKLTLDNHFVVFEDNYANQFPGDTNGVPDIYRVALTPPHTLAIAPVAGDGIISAAEAGAPIPVHGTSDAIGGSVRVLVDGIQTGTATVAADGTWTSDNVLDALAQGTHSILATVTDIAGEGANAGVIVTVDTVAPTVTISSDKVHLASGETATITFKFSEQVTSLDSGDFIVTGGVLSGVGFIDSYTATGTFAPGPGVHSATIVLPAGAFEDLAGNPNAATSATLGLAIDGYIVGATVFEDANSNGTLDAGEATTTTDANGAFVLSGGSGPIVLTGGIDIGTGLPFAGSMTAPAGATVTTPLTTLSAILIAQNIANPEQKVLAAFALNPSIDPAHLDPIAATFGGDAKGEAVFAADAVALNTVTLIAATIAGNDTAQFAGSSHHAFKALAGMVTDAASPLDLTDLGQIGTLINGALALEGKSLDANVVDGLTQIIAATNMAVLGAAQANDGVAALAEITVVERVAQGAAADALKDLGGDPTKLLSAIARYADHLDAALLAAHSQTGDVDGPDHSTPPHAAADYYSTAFGTALTIPVSGVLSNDIDADGNSLTAVKVSDPGHGSVTLNPDGSFAYDPDTGFSGLDSFSYKANDGSADGNTAIVSIDVAAPLLANRAPTVTPLTGSVREDGPAFNRDLLVGASDPDQGDALTIVNLGASLTTAGGRTLAQGSDYTLSGSTLALTAAGFAKFNGLSGTQSDEAVFHFGVSDSTATTADTLTLTINGANDAPNLVAQTPNQTATVGTAFSFALPGSTFQDPDNGDYLTLAAAQSNGTTVPAWLTFNAATGRFNGTPGPNDIGGFDLKVTATDSFGLSALDVFHFDVNGAITNHPPVITSDGGGNTASVIISHNSKYVDTVHASDVDANTTVKYSITGGSDQKLFTIDLKTGILAFKSAPREGHDYQVTVSASDGKLQDAQTINVQVARGPFESGNPGVSDTFVFNPHFGLAIVDKFDTQHDVLELDHLLFRHADANMTASQIPDLIQNHSFQIGHDVVIITDTHDVIDLRNTSLHTLNAHDFVLT